MGVSERLVILQFWSGSGLVAPDAVNSVHQHRVEPCVEIHAVDGCGIHQFHVEINVRHVFIAAKVVVLRIIGERCCTALHHRRRQQHPEPDQ